MAERQIRNKQQVRIRKLRKEREKALRDIKAAKRKSLLKKCGIALAAIVVAAAVITAAVAIIINSGIILRNKTYAESENYSISGTMMSYFIYNEINNFMAENSSTLSGREAADALKKEEVSEGVSAYDYIVSIAENKAKQYLSYAEAAHKAGIVLEDEALDNIKAKSKGMDKKSFGTGVNTSDVKACLILSALSDKYMNSEYAKIDLSEEAVAAYYAEHKTDFDTVAYRSYTASYKDDTEKAALNEAFDKIASSPDDSSFVTALKDYLVTTGITETNAQTAADGAYYTALDTGSEITKLLFSSEKGKAFTKINEEEKTCTVYRICEFRNPDSDVTATGHLILINDSSYGSQEKSKEVAEKVYNEWKEGSADEGAFARLALIYSDDGYSVYKGGLYASVTASDFGEGDLSKWFFPTDTKRAAGDVTMLRSQNGYVLIYYSSSGVGAYKNDVRQTIENSVMNAVYESLYKEDELTVNKDVLKDIK